MSDEADKQAEKDAENLRRYKEIIRFDSDYWMERTGKYDPDDLQDVRFEVINQSLWADDIDDFKVDEHWARGWVNEGDYFKREDSMEFSNRVTHRVFPTRYRLKDFRLSKSLRRVVNRNRDLKTIVRPLRLTPAVSELYLRHDKRLYDFRWKTLENKYPHIKYNITRLMQTAVFDGDKLVAFSIFQQADYSVNGDMACWDWSEHYWRRSLGIFTALLEMQYAAQKGFEYYYLADYCKHNRLYQYKTRFPGLEFYDWDNDRWIDAKTPEAEKLLNQKLNYYYKKLDLETYFILFAGISQGTKDIVGTAVFGSHDDAEREASIIEVIVLTPDVERYINSKTPYWAKYFGSLFQQTFERHGAFKTICAAYKNGLEIKFHFAPPDWAETAPFDKETRRIVKGGMEILHDPQGILEKLQNAVLSKGKKQLRTYVVIPKT